MDRRSRSRSGERMTCLRPRPVTATVTKPSWMKPEAIVGPRSASVESHGSTASLTSVLDHDSYISLTDDEEDDEYKESPKRSSRSRNINNNNLKPSSSYKITSQRPSTAPSRTSTAPARPSSSASQLGKGKNKENQRPSYKHQQDIHNNTFNIKEKKMGKKKIIRKFVESSVTDDTEADQAEAGMSPWEQWLIQKVKDDREKRKSQRLKKKEEQTKKREDEMLKQKKLQKADEIRKEWVEKKTFEEKLKIKVDKQREKTETMIKDEQKKMEQVKAERKFKEWVDKKLDEAKEKKRQDKEKAASDKLVQREQKIKAKQRFEEWCKKADTRPKPMPNSFGYTSGKLTGYHDTGAYPVPTFYNPMPWQPIHIPRPASDRKQKSRRKPKPKYAWNPEKYR